MAFTPDGMFYLSKEDYAPSMDVLGGAARGMLGIQNKEEAVNSILQGADYDTPEGRRAALDQIRQIDPTRAEALTKQNQDYETKELGLKALRNKPQLQAQWQWQARPNAVAYWIKHRLGITDAPDSMTDVEALHYITAKAGDDSTLVTDYNQMLAAYIKESKETFMTSNALTDFGDKGGKGLSFPGGDDDFSAGSKDVVDINTLESKGAGFSAVEGVDQVNPDSSGFGRYWQGSHANAQVRGRVTDIANQLSPAVFGSLTLSVAEEKLNTRNKPAFTWFTTEGRDYFIRNPKELAKAEKNPLVWYETKFKKK